MIDKYRLASDLLSIDAVRLRPAEPFKYASGLRGPIYCDNRLIISFPLIRRRFTEALKDLVDQKVFQVVAATATAAIPHGAWLSDILAKPLIYVRGANKSHGGGKRIEGAFDYGQKVVLVEDLVTSGMSSISAVQALRAEGLKVEEVISIFQYGLPDTKQKFDEIGVNFSSVLSLDTLLEVSIIDGYITQKDVDLIRLWQQDPIAWNKNFDEDVPQ